MPAINIPRVPPPTLGTAPRRISPGVWRTRTGLNLSPAASTIWEGYFRRGRTDGRGHMTVPSVVIKQPRPPQPQTPTVKPGRAGVQNPHVSLADKLTGHETAAQKRGEDLFRQTQRGPRYNPKTRQSSVADARLAAQNPHKLLDDFINSVNPTTPFIHAIHAAQHGHLGEAGGAAAAGIFGIFPGSRAAKGAKAIEDAAKAVHLLPEGTKAVEGITKAGGVPRTIEEQISHAMPANQRAYEAEQVLRTEERKARLGKAQQAFEQAGGGSAGHAAYLNELRGALPQVEFDKLTHLDEPTMDRLTNFIYDHPDLRGYDKPNLVQALGNLRAGIRATPSEQKLIEKVFGVQAAEQAAKVQPVDHKLLHAVEEVWNAPRSIMASLDVSAVLRQSLIATIHRPELAAKNIGPMFKMMFSQPKFNKIMLEKVQADPAFEQAVKDGVDFTELAGPSAKSEEQFMSKFAEKITGGRFSFVRASGRAYVGFLNLMRLHLYKDLVNLAHSQGVDLAAVGRGGRTETENIARMVNWSTGRGELGIGTGKIGRVEDASVLLNTFLFSPRLLASRFHSLNPVFYASMTPFARKQALVAMTKTVGLGASILTLAAYAGAKVVTDPRNADWGKIKIGNKRIDIWAGHQQLARLYATIYAGEIVSSTTGKKMQLSGGFGGSSRLDVLTRFARGKLAPTPSMIVDWFKGTDMQSKPFSWKKEMVDRSWPLLLQDASDIYHDTGSPWQAGLGFGIGAFGVGIQDYKATPPKRQRSITPFRPSNNSGGSWYGGSSGGGSSNDLFGGSSSGGSGTDLFANP